MPKLTHPRSPETVVDVSAARAEVLQRRGYTVVDDGPNVSDKKAVWVDHAVANGMDRDEAEDLTKDDLVDRFR